MLSYCPHGVELSYENRTYHISPQFDVVFSQGDDDEESYSIQASFGFQKEETQNPRATRCNLTCFV